MTETVQIGSATLIRGDCLAVLPTLGPVDAVVTDPPYGLEFMRQDWDAPWRSDWQAGGSFTKPGIGERPTPWPSFSATSPFGTANPTCGTCGGRLRGARKCSCDEPAWKPIGKRRNPANEGLPSDVTTSGKARQMAVFQQFNEAWAREAYRALKPGGYLLAFGGTRTWHRLACAIEDAGFVIQDCLMWVYGSGFPKGRTQLKPAFEPIVMAYKPGGKRELQIDECRVGADERKFLSKGIKPGSNNFVGSGWQGNNGTKTVKGRWPANLCHDGSDEVLALFPQKAGACAPASGPTLRDGNTSVARGRFNGLPSDRDPAFYNDTGSAARFFYCGKATKADRIYRDVEEVTVEWISEKGPSRVVLQVDTGQSPKKAIVVSPSTADNGWSTFLSGSTIGALYRKASRFIIKTTTNSTTELTTWSLLTRSLTSVSTAGVSYETGNGGSRVANAANGAPSVTIILGKTVSLPGANRAASGTPLKISVSAKRSSHPTCKPQALMRWLVQLVTPPGGTVLDPFGGSGSTAQAALAVGRKVVLIEREAQWFKDARRRIDAANDNTTAATDAA